MRTLGLVLDVAAVLVMLGTYVWWQLFVNGPAVKRQEADQ